MLVLKIIFEVLCLAGIFVCLWYLKDNKTQHKVLIPVLAVLSILFIAFLILPVSDNKSNVNKENYDKVSKGLENLENFKDDYIVSHILDAPDGSVSYLNVSTGNFNYNEYPVDKDGNIGAVDEDAKEITYTLTDWLDSSAYYTLYGDDKESGFAELPSSYVDKIKSRKYMYLDIMLDKFTSIEYDGVSKVNLGSGDKLIHIYTCNLPSSVVKEILGMYTVEMYACVKDEYSADKNIKKFCEFYLDDMNRNLACSDGIVTVGIDDAGLIRFVGIDVGGLGTRLSYSMTLVTDIKDTLRTRPIELESAVPYKTVIQEYANFVAQFDSYTDALNAMADDSENPTIKEDSKNE